MPEYCGRWHGSAKACGPVAAFVPEEIVRSAVAGMKQQAVLEEAAGMRQQAFLEAGTERLRPCVQLWEAGLVS